MEDFFGTVLLPVCPCLWQLVHWGEEKMLQFPKWCYLHYVYTIIPQRQRHRYYHYCFTIVHEVKTTWMDKNAIAINIINSVQKMTWIWCTEESNHSNLLDLSRILCTETETMRAVSWMSGMSSAKPSDSSSSVNCRNLDEPFTLVFPPLQYTHWTYCQLENKLPLTENQGQTDHVLANPNCGRKNSTHDLDFNPPTNWS